MPFITQEASKHRTWISSSHIKEWSFLKANLAIEWATMLSKYMLSFEILKG